MMTTGRYNHLSYDELIALLERRDATRRYGLVWEREGIEADRAGNDDFVVLDLDEALSTPPQDERGWRNLVIEGDNWDVLRALRAAYVGRVRCILIDPPYNTGNQDFVYNDRFVGAQDRYRQSMWLEFLYRRFVLARDLLADDGVILVCINDENRARLDLLMEQVFPGMRIGSFVWKTRSGSNDSGDHSFSSDHEHLLVYGASDFRFQGSQKSFSQYKNPDEDPLGDWKTGDLTKGHSMKERPLAYYPVQNPETGIWYPCNPTRVWAFATEQVPPLGRHLSAGSSSQPVSKRNRQPTMEEWIRRKKIVWPDPRSERVVVWQTKDDLLWSIDQGDIPSSNRGRTPLLRADLPDLDFWIGKPVSFERPWFRRHRSDVQSKTALVSSWIRGVTEKPSDRLEDVAEVITQRSGTSEDSVKEILGSQAFSFPKPPSLFRELMRYSADTDSITLDFFAGSGTTAQATLALNVEDNGGRRFIVVSSTEATAANPDKNICRDVCAERIRRVINGYGDTPGLTGDFAYLRARRVPWASAFYEAGPQSIWTLIQLSFDRPLLAFKPFESIQLSPPPNMHQEEPTLVYVCQVNDGSLASIRVLAAAGPVTLFSAAPGALRDQLGMPELSIEAVPDRLLAEFPQNVLGI